MHATPVTRLIDDLGRDTRYALQMLTRHPGFGILSILTLALGIGASTVLFTMIEATGVRTLPVRTPGDLVLAEWVTAAGMPEGVPAPGVTVRSGPYGRRQSVFAYQDFRALRRDARRLSDVVGVAPVIALARADQSIRTGLAAELVSGNYFRALGVRVSLGRPLTDDDDRPGAEPVVVLGHRLWVRQFGSDPSIIGKGLVLGPGSGPDLIGRDALDNVAVTIVGIAEDGFHGVGGAGTRAEAFLPLAPLVEGRGRSGARDPAHWWLHVLGRRASGASDRAIQNELAAISGIPAATTMVTIRSGSRGIGAGRLLAEPLLLLAPAGILLLIGCINVSTLLSARSALRTSEIAVRNALGASRRRLVRQLLTENVVLAVIAGSVGVMLSAWGKDLAGAFVLQRNAWAPEAIDLQTNTLVLTFAAGVTLLTGILCGLAPALRAGRTTLSRSMAGQSSHVARPSIATRLPVVLQVALSLTLMTSGGLLARTLYELVFVDAGFDTTGIIRIDGLGNRFNGYVDLDSAPATLSRSQVISRLATMPDLHGITVWRGTDATMPGELARWSVQPNFFDVLSIPIVAGRGLVNGDGPSVAVINEAMARRFFDGRMPVGAEIPGVRGIEIVGIARNVRINGARRGSNTQTIENVPPAYFVADVVESAAPVDIALRVRVEPTTAIPIVREIIRSVDPRLAPFVGTQDALMVTRALGGGQFGSATALTSMLALFAALSLSLVAMGLYSVTSFSMAARTREFGIRLALGASRWTVQMQVQREVLRFIGVGGIVGLAASVPIAVGFRRVIFRAVQPDAVTPAVALLVMVAVTALAAYLPARRASRIQPVVALRTE
jgi:predicted permease